MENLPCDVLSNIFIYLVAKQIAQIRCVSKSWNCLLSQSSFIKSHLHRSIHNNEKILLVFYQDEESSFYSKPFTAHRSESPNRELTNFVNLSVKLQYELTFTDCRIIGSVNGLICFCNRSLNDSVVHIWNPSLSALLTLPPCLIRSRGIGSIRSFFRFGFDPKTDDYKVVKLTRLNRQVWLQVEVYSMKKGYWEIITQSFPWHIKKIRDGNEVCVDGHHGHVHWLCYRDDKWCVPMIVAFDLNVETFREILFPVSIRDDNVCFRSHVLGVMSGKLCVMSCNGDGECEIWVMDEYGVAESWVKHHVFSHFTGDITPYGFTSQDEFVFQAVDVSEDDDNINRYEHEAYLALCDQAFGKPKTFVHSTDLLVGNTMIVEYVDSLVWVVPALVERNSKRGMVTG